MWAKLGRAVLNVPAWPVWVRWTVGVSLGLFIAWLFIGWWLLLVLAAAGGFMWWTGWRPSTATGRIASQAADCLAAAGLTASGGQPPACRLARHGSGWLLTVATPVGKSDADVLARADALAAAMGAHSVAPAAAFSRPGRPAFLVLGSDNLADVVEHPSTAPVSLSVAAPRTPAKNLRSCDIGASALGGTADINLAGETVLVAGSPGSGKSVAVWSLLLACASDPAVSLVIVDLKPSGIETLPVHKCAEIVATTDDEALVAFRRVWSFIVARNEELARLGLEKATYPAYRPVVVFVDEAAELAATDTGKEAMDLLRRIVSVGRASLVSVVLATQKPEGRLIDTNLRDLFATRICFRVGNQSQAATVLGDLPDGVKPWTIPSETPGVGFYTLNGCPVRFRAYNLRRAQIVEQANAAYHLRGMAAGVREILPADVPPTPPPAPKRQRRRREPDGE